MFAPKLICVVFCNFRFVLESSSFMYRLLQPIYLISKFSTRINEYDSLDGSFSKSSKIFNFQQNLVWSSQQIRWMFRIRRILLKFFHYYRILFVYLFSQLPLYYAKLYGEWCVCVCVCVWWIQTKWNEINKWNEIFKCDCCASEWVKTENRTVVGRLKLDWIMWIEWLWMWSCCPKTLLTFKLIIDRFSSANQKFNSLLNKMSKIWMDFWAMLMK